ncbi:MAG: T9SS type A sorting domain-containing protein [Candidatus Krumholzibacteriota bacterium]|nr:T9SS type A sorting domain-containing protein [Candidatus Krumholzibacteriota bacterium]
MRKLSLACVACIVIVSGGYAYADIQYKNSTSPGGVPDFWQKPGIGNCTEVAVANCLWYWDHNGFSGLFPHTEGDPGKWQDDSQTVINTLFSYIRSKDDGGDKGLGGNRGIAEFIKSRGKHHVYRHKNGLGVNEYFNDLFEEKATYSLYIQELSRCQNVLPGFKAHHPDSADGHWFQVGTGDKRHFWAHCQTAAGWDTDNPPTKAVTTNGWHNSTGQPQDNINLVHTDNYGICTIKNPALNNDRLRITDYPETGIPPDGCDYIEMERFTTICPFDKDNCGLVTIGETERVVEDPPKMGYFYKVKNNTLPGIPPEQVGAVGISIDVPFDYEDLNIQSPAGWTPQPWIPASTPGLATMPPYLNPADDDDIDTGVPEWNGILWTTDTDPVLPGDSLDGFSFELPDIFDVKYDGSYFAMSSTIFDEARQLGVGFVTGPVLKPMDAGITSFTRETDCPDPDLWLLGKSNWLLGYFDFETMDWSGWYLDGASPLGSFEGLSSNMIDLDPCHDNYGTVVNFFTGSTYPSPRYPALFEIPFADESSGYAFDNTLVSPVMAMNPGGSVPASASTVLLQYDAYEDLPLDNLVFHYWLVRSIKNGVEGEWKNSDKLYYYINSNGNGNRYVTINQPIGHLIEPGADSIQVAIGVVDKYYQLRDILGSGSRHEPSPWFDNVSIKRYDAQGPAWFVNEICLFQDNFPADGTITGTARIDIAMDIEDIARPANVPGDSAVVFVGECNVGLDHDDSGGPAVYAHVRDIGERSGASISGDPLRWPFIRQEEGWTILRFDSVYVSGVPKQGQFCIDLNDDLYIPGDTVSYYFSARDANGITTYWSQDIGVTSEESLVREMPCEATIFPTGNSDILYVNRFDNRGGQIYFETAFEFLDVTPDRFDVLDPTAIAGNTLASRATIDQLLGTYRIIIWSSGDLAESTIGYKAKPTTADDARLLYEFLDRSTQDVGLYLTGDGLATEIYDLYRYPLSVFIQYRTDFSSYYFFTGGIYSGGIMNPLLTGIGLFEGTSFYINGGCPEIKSFDVVESSGWETSTNVMQYPDYNGESGFAGVAQETAENGAGYTARVVLDGFSFHSIRDDNLQEPPARVKHLQKILDWFNGSISEPTGDEEMISVGTHLFQNYPNPFNPVTAIEFSISKKMHVKLKIYNIAGQLIKTLVDEVLPEGYYRNIRWDGTNDRDREVSSGVYLYKLETKEYSRTRKMVLLK